jgi:glucose/arabinose dehydrogenase
MKTLGAGLWAILLAGAAPQEVEPGLVAEYFEIGGTADLPRIPADRKPVLVRVEKTVDYDDVSGEFYGTRLESNFYARWTGILRVEKAGRHAFWTASDDGSRLSIDGKVVVNNGGVHAMTERQGEAELAAGDREILVEFFQGGGEAGCKVAWRAPGGKREPLPAKSLFHRKGAEAAIAWDKAAWEKRPKRDSRPSGRGGGKYALMDHGPFVCGTIDALWGRKGNFSNKGFGVTLDAAAQAHACFDSELLKFSSAWTGGGVGWPSGRDGIEGQPFADGELAFGTKHNTLGWARGGNWTDPRPKPFGPLPAEWGRYKGLYLHGAKTVFSYTVSGADVLDQPGWEGGVFTRVLQVGAGGPPLLMLVCDRDGATASARDGRVVLESGDDVIAAGVAGGGELKASGTRIELSIPAAGRILLGVWAGKKAELGRFEAWLKAAAPPADLAPLLRGGPGRNVAVEAAGALGTEPGAFQVDTLTVPYDNPSKSYMRLTGLDFFADGKRAAVCTFDGDVWIVSGIDATLSKLTWKRYASGLFQALGLRIVDDVVYTLGRDQITRFHDFNGDGEADHYENFNNDCGVTPAYHEFTHDLHTDAAGNFYYAKGSTMGGAIVPQHGTVVKVSKDGKSSEVVATGFRAPNGISVGPDGTLTTSDNQGNWIPTTPINYITKKGQFCGFQPCSHLNPAPKEQPPALCWIPYGQDNSGGGQVWCDSDRFGPFKGQLFHLSYGKCALFYVLREQVGDVWQGGVIRFPFKFVSGAMRARFNPADGQLYLVGMKGWQTDAARDGGLQRLRFTGKPANLPFTAKTTATSLAITFTDPLDKETASDPDSWSAAWCNLRYTGNYGSDEFWVSEPNRKGREPLPIRSVALSPDGKTVTLTFEKLQPVYYLVLKYRLKGADGSPMNQELAYTINRIP